MFGEVGMIHRKFYSILNVSWRMSSLALIIHRDRAPAWRDVSAALRILVLGAGDEGGGPRALGCASRGVPAGVISVRVPAVRVLSGHGATRVAAAVPARGDMENHRDLDPAP